MMKSLPQFAPLVEALDTSSFVSSDEKSRTANDNYRIHLNFLPIETSGIDFRVYRRPFASAQEQRPVENATGHRLPATFSNEETWPLFWVVLQPESGFDPFDLRSEWNADITRRIIFDSLKRSTISKLRPTEYRFPDNTFIQELSFKMESHPEGDEELIVQPYFLKATGQAGFLVDFHFRLCKDVPFSRKALQLSLSLDRNFKRNVDHYLDRSSKIKNFLEKRWPVFEGMTVGSSTKKLAISRHFVAVAAERLRAKVYVFAGEKESRSQFTGLHDFGPLQGLEQSPRLLFMFREQDRQAARRLALSLRGLKQSGRFNFPGFKELFKVPLDIDANPVVLPDLSAKSMEYALNRAQKDRNEFPQLLPIVVLPNDENNGYLAQKAYFSHASMPTQVCTLRILEDEESLKWAIGNLALQIFCKAGGRPWKVRPTAERSLIVGISQSHKCKVIDDQFRVEKYFAFSVLTDSSGLFQQIEVLGDSQDHSTYISTLRANLRRLLEQNAGQFNRVVIHTSFKLKHEEIRAIQQTTQEVAAETNRSKCRFAVIKVNHKSRFFGINRSVNSLIPFEASKVHLGHGEHLVWFEGIYPDKPNVTKVFPGPTHLQFLRVNEDPPHPAEQRELLQDLVNLSGANWRGFNAKSAPVSIFYCHLVADLVHDMHDQGLPLPAVKDIRPWFL